MIPTGLCQCGCGQRTRIADRDDARSGSVKGQPKRFVHGHANARGRRFRHSTGYIAINAPDHHRASPNRTVFEHILVAERAVGRALPRSVAIHHVNERKDDNRTSNLVVLENQREHMDLGPRVTTRSEHPKAVVQSACAWPATRRSHSSSSTRFAADVAGPRVRTAREPVLVRGSASFGSGPHDGRPFFARGLRSFHDGRFPPVDSGDRLMAKPHPYDHTPNDVAGVVYRLPRIGAHTPGPWALGARDGHRQRIEPGIGEVWGRGIGPEANGRLVVAAPDMLEALRVAEAALATQASYRAPEQRRIDAALLQVRKAIALALEAAHG